MPAMVSAQDGQLIGGLLRELLRSQYERRDARYRQPGQPPQQSGRPMSAKVTKVARFSGQIADESQRLMGLLQRDARRIAGVNSCIDELQRVQARAELMSTRFTKPQRQSVVLDEIRQLDREWRLVSYHLQRVRGLPQSCKTSIDRINGFTTQCCELFDIAPQLNYREIVRLADSLAAEVHHLERDVEYELRSRSKARQLVIQLRRIEAQAKLFSDTAASRGTYDIVVAEFKELVSIWNPISRTLDNLNDRHIDRTVEQINELSRALHEQLWLPMGMNRDHVNHLATITGQRIKRLLDSFSLTMLTELPDGPSILKSARSLNQEISGMCRCVTENATDDILIQHWTSLANSWNEFDHYSEPINSNQLSQLRKEISDNIEAMRQTMGIQLVFDRRAITRSVGELEGIAQQARFHIAQWQRRPGANVDAAMIRSASKLIDDVHHFHEECAGTTSRDRLYQECQQLSRDWSKLRPKLMACRTVDQDALNRISDQATEKLIRLQILLDVPQ